VAAGGARSGRPGGTPKASGGRPEQVGPVEDVSSGTSPLPGRRRPVPPRPRCQLGQPVGQRLPVLDALVERRHDAGADGQPAIVEWSQPFERACRLDGRLQRQCSARGRPNGTPPRPRAAWSLSATCRRRRAPPRPPPARRTAATPTSPGRRRGGGPATARGLRPGLGGRRRTAPPGRCGTTAAAAARTRSAKLGLGGIVHGRLVLVHVTFTRRSICSVVRSLVDGPRLRRRPRWTPRPRSLVVLQLRRQQGRSRPAARPPGRPTPITDRSSRTGVPAQASTAAPPAEDVKISPPAGCRDGVACWGRRCPRTGRGRRRLGQRHRREPQAGCDRPGRSSRATSRRRLEDPVHQPLQAGGSAAGAAPAVWADRGGRRREPRSPPPRQHGRRHGRRRGGVLLQPQRPGLGHDSSLRPSTWRRRSISRPISVRRPRPAGSLSTMRCRSRSNDSSSTACTSRWASRFGVARRPGTRGRVRPPPRHPSGAGPRAAGPWPTTTPRTERYSSRAPAGPAALRTAVPRAPSSSLPRHDGLPRRALTGR